MRVLQHDVLEPFVLRHAAIADNLDLRLVGDGLEIGVEDGALGIKRLAVSIRGGGGVETLCELKLSLGADVGLVLEDKNLVLEQSITNDVEVGICAESANVAGHKRDFE
jgi:hypothetical protein